MHSLRLTLLASEHIGISTKYLVLLNDGAPLAGQCKQTSLQSVVEPTWWYRYGRPKRISATYSAPSIFGTIAIALSSSQKIRLNIVVSTRAGAGL